MSVSIRRTLSLVLAMLWLWPADLHAQSEALIEAFRQGGDLYEVGRYEQAVPLWRKALEGSVRLNLQDVKTPMAGILRPSVHTTRPGRLRGSA